MNQSKTSVWRILCIIGFLAGIAGTMRAADPAPPADYYTEPPYYLSRPDPKSERHFGNVGVTGLQVRVYPGVVIKVEGTTPGTPADGKFAKGEIITGVNGVALKGHNPYVMMGSALTAAEAKDGKLVFEVLPAEGKAAKQVTVMIPVLGAYSPTWPLNCKKSQTIIKNAAAYYAQMKSDGVEGALACLFLLSTGDDQYLPKVKTYFDKMSGNIKGIGDHTWNNGYNGIACGEYYLRTGDKSVLPVMQYFCDDAKARQVFGIGWTHWGKGVSPDYVAGGMLNAAGAQLVTTMLLGKECGVNVDERTLLGAIRFYYRFAGRGSVAYGDHRAEGWLGSSNGKDGMAAAIMQIACDAKSNTDIYRKARNYFSQGTAVSNDVLVIGHGDEGRGDVIWRGITTSYMLDVKPAVYHSSMNEIRWWFDLSRRPSGGLGVATCLRFDDEASGACLGLAYTAPLKTLRITGAPRSKYAKDFTLPDHLWGRKADLDFLSLENAKPYYSYGSGESAHVSYMRFWNTTYTGPRADMLKNIYHWNCSIRAYAAKALMHAGEFKELEKLLEDKDARVRRAALDGLTDYNFWCAMGEKPIRTEDVSPVMVASIRKMLADPNESWFVVDGALMALSRAPAGEIVKSLPLIQSWATCDEWWIRESAFRALAAAARDEAVAPKILPVLEKMLLHEERPMARSNMTREMSQLARNSKPDSNSGKPISAIFQKAVDESPIIAGSRSDEGEYRVKDAVLAGLDLNPENSLNLARSIKTRFAELKTPIVFQVVDALLAARNKLPEAARQELTGLLFGAYRAELIRRMNAEKADDSPLPRILILTQLKHPELGWRELGRPASSDRLWQFISVEPQGKDVMPLYEGHRFRNITLPAGLENWYEPGFDAGKWSSGKAPIGKGVFKQGDTVIANHSVWGDGEFLLMRTAFDVESLDYDFFRFSILANRGYRIYLNGQEIHTYGWWNDTPTYAPLPLGPNELKNLKKGNNVLAVYANAYYLDNVPVGQLDVRLEGLKKSDLLGDPR